MIQKKGLLKAQHIIIIAYIYRGKIKAFIKIAVVHTKKQQPKNK